MVCTYALAVQHQERCKAKPSDIITFNVYAMNSSSKPKFRFVNLKHPHDLKDKETQSRIRHMVMAEVGKARRKPKTRRERNEIVFEIRDPMDAHLCLERFGGGQMDPFCVYPIEMNESNRALVANSQCATLRTNFRFPDSA
jgi:hypothetical protein